LGEHVADRAVVGGGERLAPLRKADAFVGEAGDRTKEGELRGVDEAVRLPVPPLVVDRLRARVGVKAGLDSATLLEVVAASSGSNMAAAQKFPAYVLTRTFHQGFRLSLMAKDVRLCLSEARRHNVPMLLGATVEQLWNLGEATFPDDADFIEIVRMFGEWANVTIEVGGEGTSSRG
jgi:NAD-binding of NADP-dependent 3-hydroxyisobutyrate dehydrogenase